MYCNGKYNFTRTVHVTSASQENPTVEYVAAKNKKASEIQIPDGVTVNGITYKVTAVAKNVLKGTNKKLTIKVPKNKLAAYKKYFKGKGNKTVRVKK